MLRDVRLATWWTLVGALLSACGDSESTDAPPPSTPAVPKAAAGGAKAATKAGGKGALTTYTHVEERLASDEERATFRHQFRENDFVQDLEGENRDPFRSFILATGIIDQRPGLPIEATENCSSKQMVATNYSIRDLKLVGIVSRGLRRYALMQDTANLGQIVTRGDCVGKEKARVKEIGAGYVTLEVMPETVAAGAPRVPEERSIPLYPEELPVMRGEEDSGGTPEAPAAPVVLPDGPSVNPAPAPTAAPARPGAPARAPGAAPVRPASPPPSKP
jgi:Tfp pilus assembly protein PilP